VDEDGSVEEWRKRLIAYLVANRDFAQQRLEGTGLIP